MNTRDIHLPADAQCYIYSPLDGLMHPVQSVLVTLADHSEVPLGAQSSSPTIVVFVSAELALETPPHILDQVTVAYEKTE